jgi:hypothetical protein
VLTVEQLATGTVTSDDLHRHLPIRSAIPPRCRKRTGYRDAFPLKPESHAGTVRRT